MRPLFAALACVAIACSVEPYDVKGTALDPTAPTALPATPSITPTPLGGDGQDFSGTHRTEGADGGRP
jgi:hypothetical protein